MQSQAQTGVKLPALLWEVASSLFRVTSDSLMSCPKSLRPLLAILASGEVRITVTDGTVIKANAADGFLSVENNNVTIVARDAELAEG